MIPAQPDVTQAVDSTIERHSVNSQSSAEPSGVDRPGRPNKIFILAQKRYNEMHGISTANKGNFISDMKDRNYMQSVS